MVPFFSEHRRSCDAVHSEQALPAEAESQENVIVASFAVVLARSRAVVSMFRWLRGLGGPGLFLLGIFDSSVIPIPGSIDALTVILCANQGGLWPYYAALATIGSATGAYFTYQLAQKQGKDALSRRLSPANANRVHSIFEKWGFGAILIPAILPPPMPMVPFVVAAGAMGYPLKKFLAAFSLGRIIRYTILGLLGALYGRWILQVIRNHERVLLGCSVLLVLLIVGASVKLWRNSRRTQPA
jgi:membrane protein DedA with SNARE-associated domain